MEDHFGEHFKKIDNGKQQQIFLYHFHMDTLDRPTPFNQGKQPTS